MPRHGLGWNTSNKARTCPASEWCRSSRRHGWSTADTLIMGAGVEYDQQGHDMVLGESAFDEAFAMLSGEEYIQQGLIAVRTYHKELCHEIAQDRRCPTRQQQVILWLSCANHHKAMDRVWLTRSQWGQEQETANKDMLWSGKGANSMRP